MFLAYRIVIILRLGIIVRRHGIEDINLSALWNKNFKSLFNYVAIVYNKFKIYGSKRDSW